MREGVGGRDMAAEKCMRKEDRHGHHLVTSTVPSPPFIINPTLTVFGNDPRAAVLSAHLFASYAAANQEGRFQLPIPLSIAVSSSPPVQHHYPTPKTPPSLDIISSWVTDQKETKKKKRAGWGDKGKKELPISPEGMDMSDNCLKKNGMNNNNQEVNKNQANLVTTSRDKQFTCHVCNRGFGYKHVLQNHQRTHTGEKPFECSICQKRFTRDHHLKTHMRLHTGEKPYTCTHCDRQFVQVANLRRHLRVHTGEKPYCCDLCKNRFSDSNQLKAHMLIHKGEKPYSCPTCEGRFRRRHHLHNHKCLKDSPPSTTGGSESPPSIKRGRKSRETRRIIRIESVGRTEEMDFVPEQTHPEDLSTHSLHFSSSHSNSSASPSAESCSVGLFSAGSSEERGYSTDEEDQVSPSSR